MERPLIYLVSSGTVCEAGGPVSPRIKCLWPIPRSFRRRKRTGRGETGSVLLQQRRSQRVPPVELFQLRDGNLGVIEPLEDLVDDPPPPSIFLLEPKQSGDCFLVQNTHLTISVFRGVYWMSRERELLLQLL